LNVGFNDGQISAVLPILTPLKLRAAESTAAALKLPTTAIQSPDVQLTHVPPVATGGGGSVSGGSVVVVVVVVVGTGRLTSTVRLTAGRALLSRSESSSSPSASLVTDHDPPTP
jgi:hypothetical protein